MTSFLQYWNKTNLISIAVLFFLMMSCNRPVSKDVMFCKAEEVLVLALPFDPESAIILMYKGDEVKLLGDTAYAEVPDSVEMDSSDFYVRVRAKRGVKGWVHQRELQAERPHSPPKQPARPVRPSDIAKSKKDTVQKDSLSLPSDSLQQTFVGNYRLAKANRLLTVQVDSAEGSVVQVEIVLSDEDDCQGEWRGLARWEGPQAFLQKDSCTISLQFKASRLSLKSKGSCFENEACSLNAELQRVVVDSSATSKPKAD